MLLLVVLERAEHELPGLGLEQHLDPLLDLGQALPERAHERDAALEGGERLLERELALLQALHDALELGERVFEAAGGTTAAVGLGHHGSFPGAEGAASIASMRARARPRANTRTTASPTASVPASRTTGPAASPRRTMA